MQVTLALIAAIAAALGLSFGLFSQRGTRAEPAEASVPAGTALLWGGLAILAVFLLALPAVRPFSPGLQLGWGALIGGALGLVAVARAAYRRPGDGVGHAIEQLSLAALGPAAILLVFRGYPTPALLGCALGAALAAFGAVVVLQGRSGHRARGAELYALATVLVAAGSRLGIDHFPRAMPAGFLDNAWKAFDFTEVAGGYWAVPALAVAASALVMALIPRERDGYWRALALGGAGSLAVLVLIIVLGVKLLPALAWLPPLLGLVAFGLIAVGLARQAEAARPLALAFGGALFTLVVLIIAFVYRDLHGYGQMLALLGGLPLIGVAYLSDERERAPLVGALSMGALALGVLLVLYRVFLEQAAGAWRLDFQQHYDLVAVLLGASATFGLLAYSGRTAERLPASSWPAGLLFGRASWLWGLTAVIPPVLAALWGINAVGAFLAGLIVGQAAWMLLSAWTVGTERQAALAASPTVPFLAAALIATQFSPVIFGLELTRSIKLIIAVLITLALMVWVAVDGALRTHTETGETN